MFASHAAADPAALIAQGFTRLLGKKMKVKKSAY